MALRRMDASLPWGREDEGGLISEQQKESSYLSHRRALLSVTELVDSSA
jgi:hypothetical protein